MSDLFENIALQDDTEIINHRRASAVANKRVKDRLGGFFANADNDLPARLALVEDEIHEMVEDVVKEYGGDAQKIEAAIKQSVMDPFSIGPTGGPTTPNASGGMGGGMGGGTCPQCGQPLVNGQCATCQGGTGASGAGAAYGMMHSIPQSPSTGPIQAHTGAGGFCDECHSWKSGPNKGCTCDSDSEEANDDSKSSRTALSIDTEPIMHPQPLPDEPGEEGVHDIDDELANAPSAVGTGTISRTAEALETVELPKGDESALGGPSPKIDKGNSGDNFGWSLDPIDTQMDGSPNPTIEEDPTDKADYNKKDFLDQTRAVTTTEDLPTGTGLDDAGFEPTRNIPLQDTKTWSGEKRQTDPVTNQALSSWQVESEEKWIQKAVKRPGQLHKDLGVPEDEKIPEGKLEEAEHSDNKKVRERAQFAENMKHLNSFTKEAPGNQHLPGASPKRNRQYEHIKDSLLESGASEEKAKQEAAATVNKQRAEHGETKSGALDPDKNPIRELMEEYSGHLMPNEVESAIRDWDAPSS